MPEPLRYPEHASIFTRKLHTHMLAKCRRTSPQVHGHVPDHSMGHAHELSLRVLDLIMNTAHDVLSGHREIVLHPVCRQPQGRHRTLIVGFAKGPPRIPEDTRLKYQHARQCSFNHIHNGKPMRWPENTARSEGTEDTARIHSCGLAAPAFQVAQP